MQQPSHKPIRNTVTRIRRCKVDIDMTSDLTNDACRYRRTTSTSTSLPTYENQLTTYGNVNNIDQVGIFSEFV